METVSKSIWSALKIFIYTFILSSGNLKAALYRITAALSHKETSSKQPDVTEPSNYWNFQIDPQMKAAHEAEEKKLVRMNEVCLFVINIKQLIGSRITHWT